MERKNYWVFFGNQKQEFTHENDARAFAIEKIWQQRYNFNTYTFGPATPEWRIFGLKGTLKEDEIVIVMEHKKERNNRSSVIYNQSLHNTTVLPLISINKDHPYTAEYAIKKGLVRSSLKCSDFRVKKLFDTSFGNWDGIICVTDLGPSKALYGDSICWSLSGAIPIHVNVTGRLSVGFVSKDENGNANNYPVKGFLSFFTNNKKVSYNLEKYQNLFHHNNKDFANALTVVLHRLLAEAKIKEMIG